MKLKAIIVDDELLARENLKLMIEQFCSKKLEIVGVADGVDNAVLAIEKEQPDVLFLDIRMPSGAEGFDLLNKINTDNLVVVFVTAFKDYALKAFDANALHYLLKPIDIEELLSCVEKISSYFNRAKNTNSETQYSDLISNFKKTMNTNQIERVAIHHSKGIKLVNTKSIIRIEGQGNCSELFFKDGSKYLDTRTLKIYEEMLPDYFIRIHKSHIVNLKEVKEYLHTDGSQVILSDKSSVPVSRNKLSEFLTLLKGL